VLEDFIRRNASQHLSLVRTRCDDALKALDTHDHFVVLGALAGLGQRIETVSCQLLILIEFNNQLKKATANNKNHKEEP